MKLLLWNLDAEDVPPFAKSNLENSLLIMIVSLHRTAGLIPFPIQPIQGILYPEVFFFLYYLFLAHCSVSKDQKDDDEELPPHIPDFLPPFPPKHTRLRKVNPFWIMKKMISSGAHFDQIKKPVSEPSLAEEPATTATMIASPTKPRIKRENAADSSEKEPTQKPAFAKGEKSRTGKRQVSDLYNDILMRGRTKKATSLLFDSLACSSLFFSTLRSLPSFLFSPLLSFPSLLPFHSLSPSFLIGLSFLQRKRKKKRKFWTIHTLNHQFLRKVRHSCTVPFEPSIIHKPLYFMKAKRLTSGESESSATHSPAPLSSDVKKESRNGDAIETLLKPMAVDEGEVKQWPPLFFYFRSYLSFFSRSTWAYSRRNIEMRTFFKCICFGRRILVFCLMRK